MAKHLSHQAVVSFWFHELRPAQWFRVDQKIDQHITDRFEGLVDDAFHGRLLSWSSKPSSALALVLLFDQFPRHLWRGQAKAFSGDSRALSLSIEAERQGWIQNEAVAATKTDVSLARVRSGSSRASQPRC